MTTGTVSHAETLKGWFVMMKDSKGRHAGNKLWGDGWDLVWIAPREAHLFWGCPGGSLLAGLGA